MRDGSIVVRLTARLAAAEMEAKVAKEQQAIERQRRPVAMPVIQ